MDITGKCIPLDKICSNQISGQKQVSNTSQKKKRIQAYHRINAHRNPLSESSMCYPESPESMDWSKLFPSVWNEYEEYKNCKSRNSQTLLAPRVEITDIGCGYGGLTVALSRLFPRKLTLGMDIRTPVVMYDNQRLEKLRSVKYNSLEEVPLSGGPHPLIPVEQQILEASDDPDSSTYFRPSPFPPYQNIAYIETNAMKFLPMFFTKAQLEKIFFLFPDPHFKKSKHRLRIINSFLLAEYAYVLRVGGIMYITTDVEDLYKWMFSHIEAHPLFERISEDQLNSDPVFPLIISSSEESRKVRRQNGKIYYSAFKRVEYSGKDFINTEF